MGQRASLEVRRRDWLGEHIGGGRRKKRDKRGTGESVWQTHHNRNEQIKK